MFLLKSLLLAVYVVVALLASILSIVQLGSGNFIWLSVLSVWMPVLVLNALRYWVVNLNYNDSRESPLLALSLAGVAMALVLAERGIVLWLVLGGLLSLLLYFTVLSSVTPGPRANRGDYSDLRKLPFYNSVGEVVTLANQPEVQLVVFMHAPWSPYSRMAMRELRAFVGESGVQKGIVVFPDCVPDWGQDLGEALECWSDKEGEPTGVLGVWIRGGSAFMPLARHALRPSVAFLDQQGNVKVWAQSENFRVVPDLQEQYSKFLRRT